MKTLIVILFAISLTACKNNADKTITPYNEPDMDTLSATSDTLKMKDTSSTAEPLIKKNSEDGTNSGL